MAFKQIKIKIKTASLLGCQQNLEETGLETIAIQKPLYVKIKVR